MTADRSYTDPALVAIYDLQNSGTWDVDFYVALVASLAADRVADLGCGTGILAVRLAAEGVEVIAVDPANAMLEVALARPGGDAVTWLLGDVAALQAGWADLMVMTGHVAQVFLGDDDWAAALAGCARSLRPGGRVAFESRNPEVRPWESWTPESTRESFEVDGDTVTTWTEVLAVENAIVQFAGHHLRASTGRDVVVPSSLRFRSLPELEASLLAAGLDLEAQYGDWNLGPLLSDSRELILVARLA